MFHGGDGAVDDGDGDVVADLGGEAGEGGAGEDDGVGAGGDGLCGQVDQGFGFVGLDCGDVGEGFVEGEDAGAAGFQAVPGDALVIPGLEGGGEGDDAEASAEHAGGEHAGFGEADDRDGEELAGGAEAGVGEGGDDGGVEVGVVLGEELEDLDGGDGGFGAGCDVGDAGWGGHGDEGGALGDGGAGGGVEEGGDGGGGVWVQEEDAHVVVIAGVRAFGFSLTPALSQGRGGKGVRVRRRSGRGCWGSG